MKTLKELVDYDRMLLEEIETCKKIWESIRYGF